MIGEMWRKWRNLGFVLDIVEKLRSEKYVCSTENTKMKEVGNRDYPEFNIGIDWDFILRGIQNNSMIMIGFMKISKC